jgi:shikimate dehydrogenase
MEQIMKFGLLGKTLNHSFSKRYFENKWKAAGIQDRQYELYEIALAGELKKFLDDHGDHRGFNVTIPYKQDVAALVDRLDPIAQEIKAVNCILRSERGWLGFNTDAPAFLMTLLDFLPAERDFEALVLGSGGAAAAVRWALQRLAIPYRTVSRGGPLNYRNLDRSWPDRTRLVINTSPLGQYPEIGIWPDIPYGRLNEGCLAYDLIYNPEKTGFLRKAEERGARIHNGLRMLQIQADLSELIWIEGIKVYEEQLSKIMIP